MIRTVRLCVNRAREAFRALLLELLGKHYEYRFVDKMSFLKALIHFNDEICDSPHSTPLLQKKEEKKKRRKNKKTIMMSITITVTAYTS